MRFREDPDETKRLIAEHIERCWAAAEQFYGRQFHFPSIQYSLKGTTAGTASYLRNGDPVADKLNFNLVLSRENLEDVLMDTVPHEVSHLIVKHLYLGKKKYRAHGKEWKEVMKVCFGLEAETYHTMDVAAVDGKTIHVKCGCSDHYLNRKQFNKFKQSNTVCSKCRQPYQLNGRAKLSDKIRKDTRDSLDKITFLCSKAAIQDIRTAHYLFQKTKDVKIDNLYFNAGIDRQSVLYFIMSKRASKLIPICAHNEIKNDSDRLFIISKSEERSSLSKYLSTHQIKSTSLVLRQNRKANLSNVNR